MRVLVAQIDTTVGDIPGNSEKVGRAYRMGVEAGADVVVCPELALTGYPPMDLLERRSFVEANTLATMELAKATGETVLVFGYAEPNRSDQGKGVFNAAVVAAQGRVLGTHHKVLLPTYDVFDEARYFEPGESAVVIQTPVGRLGLAICEDLWNDKTVLYRERYDKDPVTDLAAHELDCVLTLSASPYEVGKPAIRYRLAANAARRIGAPVVYCNLVGGNDGLVFDGRSFVAFPNGHIPVVLPAFRERTELLHLDKLARAPTTIQGQELREVEEEILEALCLGVRDFCGKLGFEKVAVGLSGGIDSSLVAAIATRALGPEAVIGVAMPSKYSSRESLEDAADLAGNLGIRLLTVQIQPIVDACLQQFRGALGEDPSGIVEENLQARVRGTLMMAVSNQWNALVLNTGNKSELAVGYCTLYGDMVGGLAVIGDLSKGMVYSVARRMNRKRVVIPERVFDKAPSAELRPNQKDQDTLPPYPVLDAIVTRYVEEGVDPVRILESGMDPRDVLWVADKIRRNEFKRRQAPVALKVTSRAFGTGWRFPIVNNFTDAPASERHG